MKISFEQMLETADRLNTFLSGRTVAFDVLSYIRMMGGGELDAAFVHGEESLWLHCTWPSRLVGPLNQRRVVAVEVAATAQTYLSEPVYSLIITGDASDTILDCRDFSIHVGARPMPRKSEIFDTMRGGANHFKLI